MAAGAREFGKDRAELARAAVRAWGALSSALDGRIVKGGATNRFLKVIEGAFIHPDSAVRCDAFAAWARLASLFHGMNSTVAHPARLRLLLAPIAAAVGQETKAAVMGAALGAWVHILALLVSAPRELIDRAFPSAVLPILTALLSHASSDARLEAAAVLGALLAAPGAAHAPGAAPGPLGIAARLAEARVELPLPSLERHCAALLAALGSALASDEAALRALGADAWCALAERLAAAPAAEQPVAGTVAAAAVALLAGDRARSRALGEALDRLGARAGGALGALVEVSPLLTLTVPLERLPSASAAPAASAGLGPQPQARSVRAAPFLAAAAARFIDPAAPDCPWRAHFQSAPAPRRARRAPPRSHAPRRRRC
jgi:hypothetical protein